MTSAGAVSSPGRGGMTYLPRERAKRSVPSVQSTRSMHDVARNGLRNYL